MSERVVGVDPRIGSLLAVGVASGLFSGLLGVGGVVLITLMVMVLGTRQHLAHGTSMVVLAVAGVVAFTRYLERGFLPPEAALLGVQIAVGSIVGVNLGARLTNRVPSHVLRQIFGAFMILIGLRLALSLPDAALAVAEWQGDSSVTRVVAMFLTGAVVGTVSGLLGLGGGVFFVPLLVLVLGVPQHTAQAITLVVGFPTVAFGSYAYYRQGNVQIGIALWIALSAAAAAFVGAELAAAIDEATLRRLFGVLLLPVGARMVWPMRD